MKELKEVIEFNCTECTAEKNELMSKIAALFASKDEVYYQSEATDRALIGKYNDGFEITDRLMSLRVFGPVGEIYAIRDGNRFIVRMISDTVNDTSQKKNDGNVCNMRFISEDDIRKKIYAKDERYLLRNSPSNIQNAKNLVYREYYRTDDDGLLVLECGRFLWLDK